MLRMYVAYLFYMELLYVHYRGNASRRVSCKSLRTVVKCDPQSVNGDFCVPRLRFPSVTDVDLLAVTSDVSYRIFKYYDLAV
jgi:hypothetical protein